MEKLIQEINELKARLAAINDEQAALEAKAEKESGGKFSEADRAAYDKLGTEYDQKAEQLSTLEADLKRQQDRKARKLDTVTPRRTPADSGAALPKEQPDKAAARVMIPATVSRGGSLTNFHGEVNGRSAEERAYLFGRFALAKLSTDMPHRFRFQTSVDFAQERWGLSSETGGDMASVLVPPEFGTDMIDLREQYGVIRRLFKRRQMTSDTRTDPRRAGGLTPYFVAEGAAGTESTKEWDVVRLTAKKLMVISRWTSELSEDAVISIGDDLAGEIAYAFANKEDECGINGDGTSTYGGIVGLRTALNTAAGAPTTTSAGGVIVGAGNAYSELTLANFNSVMGKLPQYAVTPNTKWLASRVFYYTVMERLAFAASGNSAVEIVNGIRRPVFLGYPVEISQVMPVTEANSQVCCLFGDFTLAASFGDRRQDTISFSDQATVGSESMWTRDQIGIRGTERFDINVHDVGNTTTAGPVVGLQTLNA